MLLEESNHKSPESKLVEGAFAETLYLSPKLLTPEMLLATVVILLFAVATVLIFVAFELTPVIAAMFVAFEFIAVIFDATVLIALSLTEIVLP